jgi:uridine kinase
MMPCTGTLPAIVEAILHTPSRKDRTARLVAVSGIDSSGKGYMAARIAERLTQEGANVALIGIDGWLNLPPVRFGQENPGLHFCRHAFRFDQMFSDLVDPLARDGEIDLVMDFTEETAHEYRRQRYSFSDIDTVLLEGIFLFRRDLRFRYDLKVWIACSFETALRRAIVRSQEGLTPEDTTKAFQTIYFPAQEIHFSLDDPKSLADLVLINDSDVP